MKIKPFSFWFLQIPESNFNIVETLNKYQKSWHKHNLHDIYIFIHFFFQVIANTLLLLSANLIGYYYQFMSSKSQKRTFEQIRSTVESRVKLECEKEHQEQLLLSVIPAYIAAEVCTLSVYFIVPRLNNLLQLPWPGFFTITILSR